MRLAVDTYRRPRPVSFSAAHVCVATCLWYYQELSELRRQLLSFLLSLNEKKNRRTRCWSLMWRCLSHSISTQRTVRCTQGISRGRSVAPSFLSIGRRRTILTTTSPTPIHPPVWDGWGPDRDTKSCRFSFLGRSDDPALFAKCGGVVACFAYTQM